jgi:hypothetical protein
MIGPGGGISPEGTRWIAAKRGFFLPMLVLSAILIVETFEGSCRREVGASSRWDRHLTSRVASTSSPIAAYLRRRFQTGHGEPAPQHSYDPAQPQANLLEALQALASCSWGCCREPLGSAAHLSTRARTRPHTDDWAKILIALCSSGGLAPRGRFSGSFRTHARGTSCKVRHRSASETLHENGPTRNLNMRQKTLQEPTRLMSVKCTTFRPQQPYARVIIKPRLHGFT